MVAEMPGKKLQTLIHNQTNESDSSRPITCSSSIRVFLTVLFRLEPLLISALPVSMLSAFASRLIILSLEANLQRPPLGRRLWITEKALCLLVVFLLFHNSSTGQYSWMSHHVPLMKLHQGWLSRWMTRHLFKAQRSTLKT